MNTVRDKFSVPETARSWGISESKVLAWIRSGELRAINIAASRCGRPRWRIDRAELERFAASRSNIATLPTRVTRTRAPRSPEVIQFYSP